MVGEVYREHFRFVWALLRRIGVRDADLEDVAQDVFIVVHRRLPEFEERASVRTWLYAIAVRVAANYKRRLRRDPEPGDSVAGRLPAPRSTDPEEQAVRTEASELLDRLLGRLDDKKRTVFVLADIEGMSAPEIARIVGTNPRTVYSRLRAARDRFHTDLARVHATDSSELRPATWARTAAAGSRPPAGADKRVWAAMALHVPGLAGGASSAVGWATAKAVAASASIGAATLGVVFIAAAPLRGDAAARVDTVETVERAAPTAGANEARSRPEARRVADPKPSAEPSVLASAIVPEPPAVAPRRTMKSAQSTPEADPLSRELELVGKARRALAAGDAAQALRWTEAYADEFPTGSFATEGARSRVAALCALGRTTDAQAVAQRTGVPMGCAAD